MKNETNILPHQSTVFLELQAALNEGYQYRFSPLPNGCMYCSANGDFYEVEDLEFEEIPVTSTNAILFKIQTKDGIKGTYSEWPVS